MTSKKQKGRQVPMAHAKVQVSVNPTPLFIELSRCETMRDYERGLRTCNRILKILPEDAKTLQCKVACLIQQSLFEDAFQCISNKCSVQLQQKLVFEKAYCLYRLNRIQEAMKFLENTDDDRCLELKAQLLYRTEDFRKCMEIYEHLLRNSEDDFDEERRTNFLAVIAQLSLSGQEVKNIRTIPPNNYEQYFNHACAMIGQQQWDSAEKSLHSAVRDCSESIEEEDELEDELAIIECQQAYCAQVQGKLEYAIELYTKLLKHQKSGSPDLHLQAVTANNLIAIHKDQMLFDSRKKMKLCTGKEVSHKLMSYQQKAICINNALLQLYSNQYEQSKQAVEILRHKFSAWDEGILIEAAILSRQKSAQTADTTIQQRIDGDEGDLTDETMRKLRLVMTQLYLHEGRLRQAYEMLRADATLSESLGILSLCVSICLANQDISGALDIVTEAIAFHKKKGSEWQVLSALLQEAANLCAQMSKPKEASKYLEELRQLRPDDVHLLARLIKAYSQFDQKRAEQLSGELAPMAERQGSISLMEAGDVEDLAWRLLRPKYGTKRQGDVSSPDGLKDVKKRRKNRKKKTKLPKNCDPNVPPDPERWIPKFERAAYKKRKDRRRHQDREIGRGTQGGAGVGDQTPESPSKPSPGGPMPASPKVESPHLPPAARQQGPPKAKQKKAKKKGGKW